MSEKISLKEAERKVFRTAVQDGLLDIFLGCFILIFVIGPYLSPSLGDFWGTMVFLPFWGAVALVLWLVRKHVLVPRVGVVRFGPASKIRLKKVNWWLLAIMMAGFILGSIAALNFATTPGWLIALAFGFVFFSAFSIAAYFLDLDRLYLYGVLTAFSPLIGEWLYTTWGVPHHGLPVTFGVSAAVMILTGVVIFIRVLQESPVPSEGLGIEEE